MARIERQHPIEKDAKYRAGCFEEVSEGFDEERALIEASRCLNCKNAPCVSGCPVNVNIPAFISKIKEKDYNAAIQVIRNTNNLPAVCGRVCPQESQCEGKCVRLKMEGAVSIGNLERFVADLALKKGTQKIEKSEKIGKKAAIIGSGPAGLTCAADLAAAGVEVTVMEAFHKTGGVLVYGIPEFRLPKALVQQEIDGLKNLGVKFELNTVVGKTVFLEELLEEFDSVFIGTGAGLPVFLKIAGENLNGVYSANEYLTRVNLMKAYKPDSNTPVQKGKNVIVVGAGNVAMDSARTAKRMGAENVKIVYRRSREEMPARLEEIRHAEEEGIELCLLTNPEKINGNNGWVTSMTCKKMELGESDASGRRRPVEIKDSEFDINCDMVIMAIGTSPNPLLKASCEKLLTTAKGTITTDNETMKTSIEGVYAGGDAVTGAATVILAMGAGKKAAKAMLEYMKTV
jgi:glutamate synthase (NADPH/NADH) small chain